MLLSFHIYLYFHNRKSVMNAIQSCCWDPQVILSQDKRLLPFTTIRETWELPLTFKATILINLHERASGQPRNLSKLEALHIWLAKTRKAKLVMDACDRILTAHPINEGSFLYRIKVFSRRNPKYARKESQKQVNKSSRKEQKSKLAQFQTFCEISRNKSAPLRQITQQEQALDGSNSINSESSSSGLQLSIKLTKIGERILSLNLRTLMMGIERAKKRVEEEAFILIKSHNH